MLGAQFPAPLKILEVVKILFSLTSSSSSTGAGAGAGVADCVAIVLFAGPATQTLSDDKGAQVRRRCSTVSVDV